ncbi:hypothetical protein JTB14_000979 [Gonioctena quinquepunctata]|nr:hypothetical protein JTB14_000979 [Gonioctena quinquepunctata]
MNPVLSPLSQHNKLRIEPRLELPYTTQQAPDQTPLEHSPQHNKLRITPVLSTLTQHNKLQNESSLEHPYTTQNSEKPLMRTLTQQAPDLPPSRFLSHNTTSSEMNPVLSTLTQPHKLRIEPRLVHPHTTPQAPELTPS